MTQHILVFQQQGSGEKKIRGIEQFGNGLFRLEVISIDDPLPTVLDDTTDYLPPTIQADLVLDFLTHPDLSHDLSHLCREQNIPLVASGKKGIKGFTPPT